MSASRQFATVLIFLLMAPFLLYAAFSFSPGVNAYVVKSGSMEPAIPKGSVMFTINVKNPSTLEEGDIITFQDGEKFVTHRIVEIRVDAESYRFRTKGDANENVDMGSISADQVVDRYIFNIPYLGYAVTYIGTSRGLILLVVLPSTLIAFLEFRKIIVELQG